MADKMQGQGMVDARDLTDYKVGLIEENIERTQTLNIRAHRKDATLLDKESVEKADIVPVSYTHLTLPTICGV